MKESLEKTGWARTGHTLAGKGPHSASKGGINAAASGLVTWPLSSPPPPASYQEAPRVGCRTTAFRTVSSLA